VAPDDIDVVVLTHLHFDHVGGMRLFPNARFLVNAAEIPWALSPKPYGLYYYPECRHHVLDVLDRIEPVQGDREVAPGVRMVWTGGHTTGHSAVFVDTPVGTVALGGDAVNTYRSLEYDWPTGNQIDLVGTMRAMNLLRTADVIVVHHSLLLEELFPGGVIGDGPLPDETAAYMARIRTAGGFDLAKYGTGA
jgi:glyoxylase-like metal-dependent hydrolase (beta-lactamase superfamily II)